MNHKRFSVPLSFYRMKYGLNENTFNRYHDELIRNEIAVKSTKDIMIDPVRFKAWLFENWVSVTKVSELTGVPVDFILEKQYVTSIDGKPSVRKAKVGWIISAYQREALGETIRHKKAVRLLGLSKTYPILDKYPQVRRINVQPFDKKKRFEYCLADINAILAEKNVQPKLLTETPKSEDVKTGRMDVIIPGYKFYRFNGNNGLAENLFTGEWFEFNVDFAPVTREKAFRMFKEAHK